MQVPLTSEQIVYLDDLIEKRGLGSAANVIHQHSAQCVRMKLGDVCGEGAASGLSRIGGLPDLSSPEAWPRRKDGSHCDFVLQVNFTEMPKMVDSPLPNHGMLSFFTDDEHDGSGRLLYQSFEPGALFQVQHPDIKSSVLNEISLVAHYIRLVPGIDISCSKELFKQEIYRVVHSDDSDDRIFELREDLRDVGNEEMIGKLLGYPSTAFNLAAQAELVSRGLRDIVHSWKNTDEQFENERKKIIERNGPDFAKYVEDQWSQVRALRPQLDEFREAAEQWKFLMEVESNFQVGLCIWDSWSYMSLIRESDLLALKFDGAYFCVDQGAC